MIKLINIQFKEEEIATIKVKKIISENPIWIQPDNIIAIAPVEGMEQHSVIIVGGNFMHVKEDAETIVALRESQAVGSALKKSIDGETE